MSVTALYESTWAGVLTPSVREAGTYAGMHVQFVRMVMQMDDGVGVGGCLLFPTVLLTAAKLS